MSVVKDIANGYKRVIGNMTLNAISASTTDLIEKSVVKLIGGKINPDPEIESVYILCDDCKSKVCYHCKKWYRLKIERDAYRSIPPEKRKKIIDARIKKLKALQEKQERKSE